ncbi:uncharacterized protein M421DRAFT_6908 [Didymella exigua CBS 183.55]|uniref:Carbohydrate-binding module family 19 domain-containing protein n=1 Tax=Didymella exigua CBS 183.55 TaxID=1150837 RepID=A0A6A5RGN3_9PLEO|nr:uncharacterized protein M421DRAFT_6908 [Didymella exigua CBS 183.55]KAF1926643.1 hypothetical protein M421DRAFT_6908 [Didymella exigua CBS 183.55]
MHFFTSISLASSLIALAGAIPTLTERAFTFCPGQSHLTPEVKCSSGFIGCAPYEKGSELCNGQKRFFNDCSGDAGLGSFFNCANGFKGCTTNPNICDTKPSTGSDTSSTPPSVPSTAPGSCRAGEGTWYKCATGFEGCSTDHSVCDKPSTAPAAPGTGSNCPAGSSFHVCASNGFRGCSTDALICDKPTAPAPAPVPAPAPKTADKNPAAPSPVWSCPKDTWYARLNECGSGFVGCTGSALGSSVDVCAGEKRFWGSCPAQHGNYYNCANGFVGCTTDVAVCDKKAQ